MSEEGGALGALRLRIEQRLAAKQDYYVQTAYGASSVPPDEAWSQRLALSRASSEAQHALETELAAVEARLAVGEKAVRFVRAWDAHQNACVNWHESPMWPPATQDALDAARDALTEEELALVESTPEASRPAEDRP